MGGGAQRWPQAAHTKHGDSLLTCPAAHTHTHRLKAAEKSSQEVFCSATADTECSQETGWLQEGTAHCAPQWHCTPSGSCCPMQPYTSRPASLGKHFPLEAGQWLAAGAEQLHLEPAGQWGRSQRCGAAGAAPWPCWPAASGCSSSSCPGSGSWEGGLSSGKVCPGGCSLLPRSG